MEQIIGLVLIVVGVALSAHYVPKLIKLIRGKKDASS